VIRRAGVAVVACLALAACGGPDAAPSSGGGEPSASSSSPVAEAPAVPVEGGPVGVTAAPDGAVWVVSPGTGTVSRIPPGADQPDLAVDVGELPLRAVAAYGAVWTTVFGDGELVRVDPGRGRVALRIRTGAEPEGVAAGFGLIWVVTQGAGDLVRVDPELGEIISRTGIGQGARLVEVGDDAVYVAQFEQDRVLRVAPGSGRITARSPEVCDGPQGMAEAGGLLWVTCTPDDLVVGLDPVSLRVRQQVEVPGQPDSVAVDTDGSLLVAASDGPTLSRVDPGEAAVVGTLALSDELPLYDEANLDLALADGEAWVSSYVADQVHHVPLTEIPGSGS
jgi:DNA-binding beta-propeller fold protein YncE